MKNDKEDDQNQNQNEHDQTKTDNPAEIKRLSLRVRSKMKGGALAIVTCQTVSCHNCG